MLSIYDYGFIGPRGATASSPEQAASLASEIGFPVVLKIESPDIVHKTDVGGVVLGLGSQEDVRVAYGQMLAKVKEQRPRARVLGVRVEEMLPEGVEIIIGLKNDPQFGPVIMFGLGGVLTEVFDDVSFRVLPMTREDAGRMIREIKGTRILQGFRGKERVSTRLLVDLLLGAARFALDLGDALESVDLNPVVVWGRQHRVLDVKMVSDRPVGSPAGQEAEKVSGPARVSRPPDTSHLATFFTPRSVAVIGASDTPGKIGHAVFDSLAHHDYRGEVFPVNPARSSIQGHKAYPDLASIESPVDLAVCTIDLAYVPPLIAECAACNVHNLVIVSGGGKELGGERARLEAEVNQLARRHNVRVIGPNCIGVFDGSSRLDTFFQPRERMDRPPGGGVAMLTQSGAVGIAFLEDAAPFGVSKFVSYGNRADVDEADLLTFLAEDPGTTVIALYVEGFDDGRRFLDAARHTVRRKPVVILKSGRSSSAASAALSHTGFFAGSYKVAQGAFCQAGLIAVDTYEDLVAAAKALAFQPRARGNRVALIGNGVGTIVQTLDLLGSHGLRLAELTTATLERLREAYPEFYVVQNPLDVTGSGTSEDYRLGIQALLDDPAVDIVMSWFVFQDAPLGEDLAGTLATLDRTSGKPVLAGTMGGQYTQRMSERLEAQDIPVLHGVREWVVAASALATTH